jgi:50S ribosomal protein L16 3-hydroxylase
MALGNLTTDDFLTDYWQKRPVLIRRAFPGFVSPLSPEALTGLALEEGVASRLILEQGGERPWELRLAPHEPGAFAALPTTHWTLLVHEVDRWIPAVGRLLDGFRFLPGWRLDDVMVSYAAPRGTVGAHIDHYDVFLLQGLGRRHWSIESARRAPGAESIPGLDVRLLERFEPDTEWVLEPGDMLYLPPRTPHLGVALDPCLTYSIGFRAPHQKELAAAFGADLGERGDAGVRYEDPDWTSTAEPGAIDAATLGRVRRMLESLDRGDDALASWFGRFATRPKRRSPGTDEEPEWTAASLRKTLGERSLRRAAPGRFAHYLHADGRVTLFVGGEAHELTPAEARFAPLLSGPAALDGETLNDHLDDDRLLGWIASWIQKGYLFVDDVEIE